MEDGGTGYFSVDIRYNYSDMVYWNSLVVPHQTEGQL